MRVADSTSIASRIEQAFQSASTSTGTSFDYLVKTAAQESSFDPEAKAKTSSATGLFQFVESTWLETLKEAGADHGLAQYSQLIEQTSGGKYRVSDPEMRQEIMNLRKDPDIASVMAGVLTQKNANHLGNKLGREPTDGELYVAHFLGATGANRLINAAETDGAARADKLFPVQARANRSIFYQGDGSPRSAAQVYDVLVSKHDAVSMIAGLNGPGSTATSRGLTQTAAATGEPMLLSTGVLTESGDVPGNLDVATRRVLNAFQATETANPFEALFRNDEGSNKAEVASRFATAFAAIEQTGNYSSLGNASSKVMVQALAVPESRGPLDLTRFLRFGNEPEQKDLLPPV